MFYTVNGLNFGKCIEVQRTDIFIENRSKMYSAPAERNIYKYTTPLERNTNAIILL